MIDKETIQRIVETSRIEEVIGEFVSLKKRGVNHIGCCPFHNEKTPSFIVSPAKNIYKCFGCGEAGDVVHFLMKHEHYTYPEALRWLAKKYNIEIQEEELTEEQKARNNERDALFHVSEFAQKYFADLLYQDEMGRAVGLSYFHSRGMSDEIIKRFGLGYCLDEWRNFTDHARKSGYSDDVLGKTGLTIFKEDGKCFDRFRGRVTFPIYSVSGRVLGFSCRTLSKDKQTAKYVNSPESEIYHKANTLYGLYQARAAIRRQDKCYLVEGNVDVISMHQSGLENTVASCGTALTSEQVRLIKSQTPNVTVLYDGDAAGIHATIRAVGLLFEEGMHVRVALFPDGEDPDSYAQKYGSTQLQEFLAQHEEDFLVYRMRQTPPEILNDPIRKTELEKEIISIIALIPDLLERTAYIQKLATLVHTPEQTLFSQLAKVMDASRKKSPRQPSESAVSQASPAEQQPAEHVAPYPIEDTQSIDDPLKVPLVPRTQAGANPVEKKIISLLLNYGQKYVELEGETYAVAALIVSDLMGDNLSFDDPVCQKIFDAFVEGLGVGTIPEAASFVTSEDPVVSRFAAELLVDNYQISKNWADKKQIYVPTRESKLIPDMTDSIWAFKLFKLDQRIADNTRRWHHVQTEEDYLLLLAEKNELVKYRQQIYNKICHRPTRDEEES